MNFETLESKGKRMFERYPSIKRSAKRLYQTAMYAVSRNKFKSKGDMISISPDDGFEYFYGYYDKSPWDADNRYILVVRARTTFQSVAPKESAEVVLLDSVNQYAPKVIATTRAWNVQQGCMAQWLGPDFKSRVIYNDFQGGQYCSIVYNAKTNRQENVYRCAVYDVARDGSYALTLDFSRLHRLRPGYGYSNLLDDTRKEKVPTSTAVWKLDLQTGAITSLCTYRDFFAFEPDESMVDAIHKVNHLMISPNGKRFMVLHRWFQKGRKHTRLITMDANSGNWCNLSDDVFASHCFWKNNDEILGFLRKKDTGDHYYLMRDKTTDYILLWPELKTDGHCSYSPDGNLVVTDTYPNNKRIASVYICEESLNPGAAIRVAQVFSPFKYDNDTRCDLHPRWNRTGDMVCFDSVHNGKRGLYALAVDRVKKVTSMETQSIAVSVVIPTHNREDLIERAIQSVLNQTHTNLEVIVISDGSTDQTAEIVQGIARNDRRIRFIQYHPSRGANTARNTGIENAKYEYVAFLDDDDEWHADKIEKQLALFAADPDIGICCTGKNNIFVSEGYTTVYIPNPPKDARKAILLKNIIGSTTTVVAKKSFLVECGCFDINLPALQDYDMWIRMCQKTVVGVVKEPLVEYYNYSGNSQISSITKKYLDATEYIDQKYQHLFNSLSKQDMSKKQSNSAILLAKKGLRNNQRSIAIKYGAKAFWHKPSISAAACVVTSMVPYTLLLKFKSKCGKRLGNFL